MTKKAKQSFAYGEKDGSITVIVEDWILDDSDARVKARPEMFEDVVPDHVASVRRSKVEQATAAPGEERNL